MERELLFNIIGGFNIFVGGGNAMMMMVGIKMNDAKVSGLCGFMAVMCTSCGAFLLAK